MPCHRVTSFLFAVSAACGILAAAPAIAADGQIVITDAKTTAGNVTPGDGAGYPARLTVSGSYILGSNLTPGSGLDGIVAAAPDISIDLNGFKISGGAALGVNNGHNGILDQGDRLTVTNGTIGAFTNAGIYARNRQYLVVENMRIINGRGRGIDAEEGDSARIQNNIVSSNLGAGIACGRSCHVEGNVVSFNGTGILGGFLTVLGNSIMFNRGYGIEQVGTSDHVVTIGNNTLVQNNARGDQAHGAIFELQPNYCEPPC